MDKNLLSDILKLSVPERIQLVQDVWDSIAVAPEPLEFTEDEKQEFDARVAAYREDPSRAIPWQQVRARLRKPQ